MKINLSKTQRITAIAGVVVVGILIFVMKPAPLGVDGQEVRVAELTVVLEEEGTARVRNSFTVSSPVNGRLLRMSVDEGMSVKKGAVVARIMPPPLGSREYDEADARARSAEAVLEAARATERQVKIDLDQAARKYKRYSALFKEGAISAEVFESVKTSWLVLQKQHQAAKNNVESVRYDLEALQLLVKRSINGNTIEVPAPVTGKVLRVHEKSERIVAAGTPLLEIGDPLDSEIVIDVLSSDAVKVEPGMKVLVEGWGGSKSISGTVREIEPAAFTKISALGIEEKRVNIIVELQEPEVRLGDNYRVQASIILWQGTDVLQVPVSSIFRSQKGWTVFLVKSGKAERHPVAIGKRGAYYAEVIEGLKAGDVVVIHPTNDLEDGMKVKVNVSKE